MNPELDAYMAAQADVFSAQQAAAAGISRQMRRTLVQRGVLREVRRGIFTLEERWQGADHRGRHMINLAGALLVRGWDPATSGSPRWVGGHRTAGFLHQLPLRPRPQDAELAAEVRGERRPIPRDRAVIAREVARLARDEGPWHVHLVSADRCLRTYRNGVDVRPAALPPQHVTLLGAVPVTSIARTAVDLMRDGTFSDAVMVADAALRLGVSRADLSDVTHFCAGWRNGLQAIAAVEFADAAAESPAESLARVVCHQAGLTGWELQADLYDRWGRIGRVDLLFRLFRVVLEVDGYVKYTDPWSGSAAQALEDEAERERRLVAAGWIVIRTTWDELMYRPGDLVARLLAAFAMRASA